MKGRAVLALLGKLVPSPDKEQLKPIPTSPYLTCLPSDVLEGLAQPIQAVDLHQLG